jgi:hypothetical protein
MGVGGESEVETGERVAGGVRLPESAPPLLERTSRPETESRIRGSDYLGEEGRMERAIAEIYSELLESRRKSDPGYERIYQSVVMVAKRRDMSLRVDAVYFLANNISEMIFGPTNLARKREVRLETGPVAPEEQLYSALDGDLGIIIDQAVKIAQGRERSHISAASVIVGLGQVIDGLKINDWKLWGRSN